MLSKLLKKYKKAIGGAITTAVTYVVVTKLGGSEGLAIAIATPLVGVVVTFLKNITNDLDEALDTGAAYDPNA